MSYYSSAELEVADLRKEVADLERQLDVLPIE